MYTISQQKAQNFQWFLFILDYPILLNMGKSLCMIFVDWTPVTEHRAYITYFNEANFLYFFTKRKSLNIH